MGDLCADAERRTAAEHVVLIIEDEPDIAEVNGVLLETLGYQVVVATDGVEALQLLWKGLRPCVILLDLMLPVMDGIEFRRQLLADPALADIPVVVVSGVTDRIDLARLTNVVACYRKPVDWDKLLGTVAQLCPPSVP